MTADDPRPGGAAQEARQLLAQDAVERGEGICRTCLAPIWNEGGTVGHRKRAEGWSDRIERGGDSLVCFKAVDYRHVPLAGREAAIYDHAYARGATTGRAGFSVPNPNAVLTPPIAAGQGHVGGQAHSPEVVGAASRPLAPVSDRARPVTHGDACASSWGRSGGEG